MKILTSALVCSVALTLSASASIVFTITARQLSSDELGATPIVAGTLIQLVNLGPEGQFSPIDLSDGDVSQFGQWVSGNDSLITATFLEGLTENPNFSGAAFDLSQGADPAIGRLLRDFTFELGGIPAGAKLGIRWFPALMAADFNSITLVEGQKYGQFTRQSDPQNGLDLWVAPGDGGVATFDNLKTVSASGTDANTVGAATFTVIPEPTAIAMSLIGAAGLGMLRRRRA
jgi:hypothetical protein